MFVHILYKADTRTKGTMHHIRSFCFFEFHARTNTHRQIRPANNLMDVRDFVIKCVEKAAKTDRTKNFTG